MFGWQGRLPIVQYGRGRFDVTFLSLNLVAPRLLLHVNANKPLLRINLWFMVASIVGRTTTMIRFAGINQATRILREQSQKRDRKRDA
jgi:hypothetical protein